jgi:hypothetical protein
MWHGQGDNVSRGFLLSAFPISVFFSAWFAGKSPGVCLGREKVTYLQDEYTRLVMVISCCEGQVLLATESQLY